MVLWQNTFFLRKEPAEELVAAMQHAQGTHLWLPLPAARAMPKWPLRERLEEVMVEGAKGVKKLGEREGNTGSWGFNWETYIHRYTYTNMNVRMYVTYTHSYTHIPTYLHTYITLHSIPFHCIALHYITLHSITYIYIYLYVHIHIHVHTRIVYIYT